MGESNSAATGHRRQAALGGQILSSFRVLLKTPIHLIWDVLKMRRAVISYVNRFFSVTTPELGDVCYRRVVQRPESVLVEGFNTLLKANLDTIR